MSEPPYLSQCGTDVLLLIIGAAGMQCYGPLMLTSRHLCALISDNKLTLSDPDMWAELFTVPSIFYSTFSMKQRICLCDSVANTLDVAFPPIKKEYVIPWYTAFTWVTSSSEAARWFKSYIFPEQSPVMMNCLLYFRALMYRCAVYRIHIVEKVAGPTVALFTVNTSPQALMRPTLFIYNLLRNNDESYIMTVVAIERQQLWAACII